MSRLLLVRHGESTANVAHRLETRPPGAALTDRGHTQSRALVDTLAGHDVVAVHASVATRAQQTAAPLAAALGLEVVVEPGTQETDAGELEGRADEAAHEEFTAVYARWLAGEQDVRVPGGESAAEILDRYRPVLDRLAATDEEGDVVLVSHGAVIRLVAAALTGVDPGYALARRLDNTERVELVVRDGTWECLRWGDDEPPFRPPAPDEEPPEAM